MTEKEKSRLENARSETVTQGKRIVRWSLIGILATTLYLAFRAWPVREELFSGLIEVLDGLIIELGWIWAIGLLAISSLSLLTGWLMTKYPERDGDYHLEKYKKVKE